MPGLTAHCPRNTIGPVQGMALLSRALRARRLRTSSHGEERSRPGPRHPARAYLVARGTEAGMAVTSWAGGRPAWRHRMGHAGPGLWERLGRWPRGRPLLHTVPCRSCPRTWTSSCCPPRQTTPRTCTSSGSRRAAPTGREHPSLPYVCPARQPRGSLGTALRWALGARAACQSRLQAHEQLRELRVNELRLLTHH